MISKKNRTPSAWIGDFNSTEYSFKPSLSKPVKPDKEKIARNAGPKSNFLKGDQVEVWSSNRKIWLDGVVKEIFIAPGSWDRYSVPAGAIKVETAIGVKFFRPEETSELRRK